MLWILPSVSEQVVYKSQVVKATYIILTFKNNQDTYDRHHSNEYA